MVNPQVEYQKAGNNITEGKIMVLNMYSSLNRTLKSAETAISTRNIEKAHNSLTEAQNILYSLNSVLDFEKGGEIAKSLSILYEFMTKRLQDANLKKDLKLLEEVMDIANDLEVTWNKILL